MSKKEGDILINFIKSRGIAVEDFAEKAGYRGRQGLYYQLKKGDTLSHEFKLKAAEVLGVDVEEIFGQNLDKVKKVDEEKEVLKKLVQAQESLLKHQNEFITAQMIRLEAFEETILAKVAEIQAEVVPRYKGRNLDAILDEAEQDVRDKTQEIRKDLGLSASS
ncbi:hypothetical protein [Chitinophaga sp. sic0106]|uniref:hypothetical protein n=1 Tax=Chitinophaga sp. sic0106 TaxID=2854785 RepID=UPI001C44F7AB|nr:hypothetical protein [Chitinophaga sp. sic0106]MBV7534082.1 hypothetical protein [Chitinophaga sp. sic0106]